MISIRAYRVYNRMIVHFFDSGSNDALQCPECSWTGQYSGEEHSNSIEPQAIDCPRCMHPLGILTQPLSDCAGIPAFL